VTPGPDLKHEHVHNKLTIAYTNTKSNDTETTTLNKMADNNGNADKKTVEGKEGGDPKKAAQGGGADTGVSTTTSTKGAGMRCRSD
jgi:hypothetical protein